MYSSTLWLVLLLSLKVICHWKYLNFNVIIDINPFLDDLSFVCLKKSFPIFLKLSSHIFSHHIDFHIWGFDLSEMSYIWCEVMCSLHTSCPSLRNAPLHCSCLLTGSYTGGGVSSLCPEMIKQASPRSWGTWFGPSIGPLTISRSGYEEVLDSNSGAATFLLCDSGQVPSLLWAFVSSTCP